MLPALPTQPSSAGARNSTPIRSSPPAAPVASWINDTSGKRRFIGAFGGFVFIPSRSMSDSDLQSFPNDLTAILEDYEPHRVVLEGLQLATTDLPPILLQLGREASLLCVCVLRKYVFAPEPTAGSMSRAVLQSLLNLAMEYSTLFVACLFVLCCCFFILSSLSSFLCRKDLLVGDCTSERSDH
jgi:hypothetical protein